MDSLRRKNLRKIKRRKAAGFNKISPEVWKTRKFDDILLWLYHAVYEQNTIEKWTKVCILPFPKYDDLGITMNYRGITLSAISAKTYKALLLNHAKPENEKIRRKNQNSICRNQSTISQILTIHWIIEGVCVKNLEATLLFISSSKAFDSFPRKKWNKPY